MVKDQAWSAVGLSMLLATVGCAAAEIPYRYPTLDRARPVAHDLVLAVLPFRDARGADAAGDSASGFSYRNVEYAHTDLDDLARLPEVEITQIVARHLAFDRAFRQVVLVNRVEDAAGADLVLSASVRRARGYVELEGTTSSTTSSTAVDRRRVIAEVLLDDVVIREAKGARRPLVVADLGWAIFEARSSKPQPPSPWAVLADGLRATVEQLRALIAGADLSGGHIATDRVDLTAPPLTTATATASRFGALPDSPPQGWQWIEDRVGQVPHGWRGPSAACLQGRLVAKQRVHFHRVLGPYRPTVVLWWCAPEVRLSYDPMTELPAEFLGVGHRGGNVLIHAVGETNWPEARRQIAEHLDLVPPPTRYIFKLGK